MDARPVTGSLRQRATMRDVAAAAGVSVKTVSRVVNGEAGVRAALRTRVQAVVDQLEFRPDAGARTLRRADRRTASIALLLEDVANPYSATVARAVEDVAVARGVMVFSASLDEDPVRERALVREFGARSADGLILAPASDDQSYLRDLVAAGTAVVCVDRAARHLPVDSVITTNVDGAAEAVTHMASAGHRRIAFLGDTRTIATAAQRFDGYRRALAELGLPPDPALVVHDLHASTTAAAAVTRLLTAASPPTALFTAQNLISIGAVRALQELGAQHTVALVGFDDFPLSDLVRPGVTVVAQDASVIGRVAAELLFARIDGSPDAPTVRSVATRLIPRGSGEITP